MQLIRKIGKMSLAGLMDAMSPCFPVVAPKDVDRFVERFRSLSYQKSVGKPDSEQQWCEFVNRILKCAISQDLNRFLRWDVLLETMVIPFAPWVRAELSELSGLPNWKTRWVPAIQETTLGSPIPYPWYPKSSGQSIHYAYAISQLEKKLRLRLDHLDLIVEFGGGYGGLARIVRNLGFGGVYVIFDWRALGILQEFYLSSLGMPVRGLQKGPGAAFVSTPGELASVLGRGPANAERRLFLATWSLSEAPVHTREAILPLVRDCEFLYIAAQHRFHEVDNLEYFSKRLPEFGFEIEIVPLPHIPGQNSAMFGFKAAG